MNHVANVRDIIRDIKEDDVLSNDRAYRSRSPERRFDIAYLLQHCLAKGSTSRSLRKDLCENAKLQMKQHKISNLQIKQNLDWLSSSWNRYDEEMRHICTKSVRRTISKKNVKTQPIFSSLSQIEDKEKEINKKQLEINLNKLNLACEKQRIQTISSINNKLHTHTRTSSLPFTAIVKYAIT
jgi:hypothetical protein